MKLPLHLFAWPSRHNVHLALPLFLVVSFLLHVAGVAIFQVSYPRAHANSERSAEVYFLRAGTPEAARLAPMLAASDPALFSPGIISARDAWDVPETVYVANFDAEKPSLEALSPRSPGTVFGPPVARGPVTESVSPYRPAKSRTGGLPTTVRLEGGLKGRTLTPPKEARFSSAQVKDMNPTSFLVAVSPEGLPMHIFPIFSPKATANDALRQSAQRYLAACRFSPDGSKQESVWGTVTFLWGQDVERTVER